MYKCTIFSCLGSQRTNIGRLMPDIFGLASETTPARAAESRNVQIPQWERRRLAVTCTCRMFSGGRSWSEKEPHSMGTVLLRLSCFIHVGRPVSIVYNLVLWEGKLHTTYTRLGASIKAAVDRSRSGRNKFTFFLLTCDFPYPSRLLDEHTISMSDASKDIEKNGKSQVSPALEYGETRARRHKTVNQVPM
jgi:hypothetical protein